MDNTNRNDRVIDLNAGERPPEVTARVRGMTTKVKKITTTDEAKLQVVLETEGMDDEALEQIKQIELEIDEGGTARRVPLAGGLTRVGGAGCEVVGCCGFVASSR